MTEILAWPTSILEPSSVEADVVAFTRSGGTTLGGLQRVVRTDRGWWEIVYGGVPLKTPAERRMWNAVAEHCGGMAGLLAVPVPSLDSAPWPAGTRDGQLLVPHSDGSSFSDGSRYAQPAIGVTLVGAAAIGATSVTLRIVHGIEELVGVRFSYQHALYRTGLPTAIDGTDWTVPISPAIRSPIPDGVALEFGMPTCLVRLAADRAMDARLSAGWFDQVNVSFVEAADYWSDLAVA